ncbi:MAG TPA: alanine racemase [Proteobacteria bacterium]|nr:alanine racemase [Pseudomonadota bacterium]
MFVSRPTVAEIDLGALRRNYAALKVYAGPQIGIVPVIKADAYGHGAQAVAACLARAGVPGFAVSTVPEAQVLKGAGIKETFLILGPLYEDDLPLVIRGGMIPVLWEAESAARLSALAVAAGRRIPVQVKIDTGMHRAGVMPDTARDFIALVEALPGLELCGLLSHLAVADGELAWERRYTAMQASRFAEIRAALESEKTTAAMVFHLANSAGLLRYNFPGCNQARVGLALYGSYPDAALRGRIKLHPVMTVKSGIILLKKLKPGQSVSYGCLYTAREEVTLALLPIGYADGLRRELSGRGEVLVRGRRAPLIGRICMDWTMADVSEIDGVAVGDEVVIMGRQGDEEISVEELAASLGTIAYEILCTWSERVRRVYKQP